MKKILIVDDESNTREALMKYLRGRFNLTSAPDGESAIKLLQKNDYDLVLTDLRMPGVDGMGVLEAALSKACNPKCIVFTAYGSVETAVEAVKKGAFDFLTKPVKLEKLEAIINAALTSSRASADSDARSICGADYVFDSPEMAKVLELIETVAPAKSTVLITGESGTGKEVAANLLHKLSRRTGLFVPVHCAALPENLLESELFGHEKGAFTGAVEKRKGRFELADGGTLFLDEIGEIPLSIQVKLLRVLETRTFERLGGSEPIKCDVRLIAATNRNLSEMVSENQFREDLFYRLNVVNLEMPPLRHRPGDIAKLAGKFLKEYSIENHKSVPEITPETMEIFQHYNWPGNVRELKNCMERLAVLNKKTKIEPDDLPANLRNAPPKVQPDISGNAFNLDDKKHALILKALQESDGNRTLAAEKLGISRRTLQRYLKEYEIK